ncbi:MAG: peptidase M18 [Acidobacteria bacterium]|nr:peptidase M18 [Acidobacteriota bacterium]
MNGRIVFFIALLTVFSAAQDNAPAQQANVGGDWSSRKSGWLLLHDGERNQVESFAKDYKKYMSVAKTAMTSTHEVMRQAKAAGFADFTSPTQVKPGAKLIFPNRERALILAVIGSEPMTSGSRLIGAHQDSPHIDLKSRPIYAAGDGAFAMFRTIYYGGIKKYQWSNLPLGLVGHISTVDGRQIDVSIGFNPGDPLFVIPDNAPHSDTEMRMRNYTDVLKGEELDPVVGNEPAAGNERNPVAAQAERVLTSTYKIHEEDLVSSELALVPAAQPADVGLDRSMIGAYGQDDKLSSYCAARALMDVSGTPRYTALAYLANFEEVGSVNNTGAASAFLNSTYAEIAGAQAGHAYNDLDLRRALRNSEVISADTNDGINPIFPSTSEPTNSAKLSYGVAVKKYGRGFDAPSELTAKIIALLDRNSIPWQTQTPKVDVGGGGTIGGFMSREDMNVIDFGIPLLSMHSTYEISSKVDLWNYYRFMKAFYADSGKQ